jgi:hypothetical protein
MLPVSSYRTVFVQIRGGHTWDEYSSSSYSRINGTCSHIIPAYLHSDLNDAKGEISWWQSRKADFSDELAIITAASSTSSVWLPGAFGGLPLSCTAWSCLYELVNTVHIAELCIMRSVPKRVSATPTNEAVFTCGAGLSIRPPNADLSQVTSTPSCWR